MKSRILITGGTGLVGTDLLSRLVWEGYDIYCISRKPSPMRADQVHWISADLSADAMPIVQSLPTVDCIIHAAAVVKANDSENELALFRKTNMEFTEALFQWARHGKVGTVIYVSGFNTLKRPLAAIIDEHHPLAPLTPYAITKYWGELALFRNSMGGRFRPVALRVSSPIALHFPLLHDTVVKKWIDLARNHRPIVVFGTGTRTQDFVCTEDIAQAVVQVIENSNAHGVYHIASGTHISMLELAQLIATRWNTNVVFAPEDNNDNECWNISINKAKHAFGYTPRYTARTVIEALTTKLH